MSTNFEKKIHLGEQIVPILPMFKIPFSGTLILN